MTSLLLCKENKSAVFPIFTYHSTSDLSSGVIMSSWTPAKTDTTSYSQGLPITEGQDGNNQQSQSVAVPMDVTSSFHETTSTGIPIGVIQPPNGGGYNQSLSQGIPITNPQLRNHSMSEGFPLDPFKNEP